MSLALVIPVHNDHAPLRRLLAQAAALGCFDQIVVVDDGSERPVRLPRLRGLRADLLRHRVAQGAGTSRNHGLEMVKTTHLLFFDADDSLAPGLPGLLRALSGQPYDFCMFSHVDSRFGAQPPRDAALWRCAGAQGQPLHAPGPRARAALSETTNYPWNKIYRTAFLRAHDIRCSATPVHNDIALHWRSFIAADRVLCADVPGARHRVAPGAGRLTNRRGRQRLCVFGPLDQVAAALAAPQGAAYRAAFLRFACALLDWIAPQLPAEDLPQLRARGAQFLAAHRAWARGDPALYLRLGRHLEALC